MCHIIYNLVNFASFESRVCGCSGVFCGTEMDHEDAWFMTLLHKAGDVIEFFLLLFDSLKSKGLFHGLKQAFRP